MCEEFGDSKKNVYMYIYFSSMSFQFRDLELQKQRAQPNECQEQFGVWKCSWQALLFSLLLIWQQLDDWFHLCSFLPLFVSFPNCTSSPGPGQPNPGSVWLCLAAKYNMPTCDGEPQSEMMIRIFWVWILALFLAVWPWESYLTSLCLRFLICKRRMIIATTSQG